MLTLLQMLTRPDTIFPLCNILNFMNSPSSSYYRILTAYIAKPFISLQNLLFLAKISLLLDVSTTMWWPSTVATKAQLALSVATET